MLGQYKKVAIIDKNESFSARDSTWIAKEINMVLNFTPSRIFLRVYDSKVKEYMCVDSDINVKDSFPAKTSDSAAYITDLTKNKFKLWGWSNIGSRNLIVRQIIAME